MKQFIFETYQRINIDEKTINYELKKLLVHQNTNNIGSKLSEKVFNLKIFQIMRL